MLNLVDPMCADNQYPSQECTQDSFREKVLQVVR